MKYTGRGMVPLAAFTPYRVRSDIETLHHSNTPQNEYTL